MEYFAIVAGGMFSYLYMTPSNTPSWWLIALGCVMLVGLIKWPR